MKINLFLCCKCYNSSYIRKNFILFFSLKMTFLNFKKLVLCLSYFIITEFIFIFLSYKTFLVNKDFEQKYDQIPTNLKLMVRSSYDFIRKTHSVSPSLEVNAIIPLNNSNPEKILLINRGHYPYGLALPGGHAEIGETIEQCLSRETKEETNLTISDYDLFGVYSEPKRDPREHVVAFVYDVKVINVSNLYPGDDVDKAIWYDIKSLLSIKESIVFDHYKIITDYAFKKGLL
jgi:8-oxo-dGTP diphosphatase